MWPEGEMDMKPGRESRRESGERGEGEGVCSSGIVANCCTEFSCTLLRLEVVQRNVSSSRAIFKPPQARG